MHTAMTWQGQPVRAQHYDVVRDGYILVMEDGTSTFMDRHCLQESSHVAEMRAAARAGSASYRPQSLISFAPSAPAPALPVPAKDQGRTRVITDYGWGGADARPRSRRLLHSRHKRAL